MYVFAQKFHNVHYTLKLMYKPFIKELCFDLFSNYCNMPNVTKIDDLAPGVISISIIVRIYIWDNITSIRNLLIMKILLLQISRKKNILQFANWQILKKTLGIWNIFRDEEIKHVPWLCSHIPLLYQISTVSSTR